MTSLLPQSSCCLNARGVYQLRALRYDRSGSFILPCARRYRRYYNVMMIDQQAFQDLIPNNSCFGCGPHNEHGLRIKSFWDDDESICTYRPQPYQAAGPPQYLNGGIIATLTDCHCICTAIAHAYRSEGRPIGSEPSIWCATGRLEIRYLRPTPIDEPVHLRARIIDASPRKAIVRCTVSSRGDVCAEAEVVAVRVSDSWRHGR